MLGYVVWISVCSVNWARKDLMRLELWEVISDVIKFERSNQASVGA